MINTAPSADGIQVEVTHALEDHLIKIGKDFYNLKANGGCNNSKGWRQRRVVNQALDFVKEGAALFKNISRVWKFVVSLLVLQERYVGMATPDGRITKRLTSGLVSRCARWFLRVRPFPWSVALPSPYPRTSSPWGAGLLARDYAVCFPGDGTSERLPGRGVSSSEPPKSLLQCAAVHVRKWPWKGPWPW